MAARCNSYMVATCISFTVATCISFTVATYISFMIAMHLPEKELEKLRIILGKKNNLTPKERKLR